MDTNKIIRNILGSSKFKFRKRLQQESFTSIKNQKFTDKELIQILQNLAQELGRIPMERDMDNYSGAPSSGTYDYRFGGWNKALEFAGIPIKDKYHQYTEEKLIKILQNLAQKLGRTPKESDFRYQSNLPALTTFKTYFGSWSNALREANVYKKNKIYTKEDLIKILKQVSYDLNKIPTEDDLDKYPELPQSKTFVFHFGSWNNALRKAGFKVRKKW